MRHWTGRELTVQERLERHIKLSYDDLITWEDVLEDPLQVQALRDTLAQALKVYRGYMQVIGRESRKPWRQYIVEAKTLRI